MSGSGANIKEEHIHIKEIAILQERVHQSSKKIETLEDVARTLTKAVTELTTIQKQIQEEVRRAEARSDRDQERFEAYQREANLRYEQQASKLVKIGVTLNLAGVGVLVIANVLLPRILS
jgi:hypothetical protein